LAVNNPYQQYKKTQIDTADQGKLIVMLYDGAIRAVNKAIELMPAKEIEQIHNSIIKAQEIVMELTSSLNMDVGEISEKLFSIYMYINNKLTEANVKKEVAPLREVKLHLEKLREAWEAAAKKEAGSGSTATDTGGVNIAT
jgi:flagellar protein FliS